MEALKEILVIVLVLTCLISDLLKNKIYNAVIFPAIILGFLINGYLGGIKGFVLSLEGMFLGMLFLFIPYLLRGIGAGDVKFLGTIGAIKGPAFTLNAFLYSAIAGGIISLAIMFFDKNSRYKIKSVFLTLLSILGFVPKGLNLLENLDSPSKKGRFPYGIAITLGTIAAFIFSI